MNQGVLDQERTQVFHEMMQSSYKKVYQLAYRLSGDRTDAEDLTQEAFFRAYRGFQTFEGDKPFENWIFRIVTRLFLDLKRTRKRRIQAVSYDAPIRADGSDDELHLQAADSAPTPEQALVQNTMSESMKIALDALSADQRSLVILADIEQLSYQEIAEMEGIPLGTVRSRLHRAHKRMRTVLQCLKDRDSKSPRCRGLSTKPCFG